MERTPLYSVYRDLRDCRELTDYSVAKDTGIAPTVFSEWKKGKSAPKSDKIYILSQYFGVPMEAFMREKE